ncbi:TPA: helix-turn-helix domain-containing protein [Pluralibacter gergoviae]|nr:helix-turn-helix domain-containing protein [Pluralibacter gergoviae]
MATSLISIVLYPGFKLLEATGPLSVFNYANARLAAAGKAPGYDVAFAASAPGPVMSDNHISLLATVPLASPDLLNGRVILLGSPDIENAVVENGEIVAWLKNSGLRVRELVALCSGSFFLAEAGLLNGLRATTHWRVSDKLQQRYPAVNVDSNAIFIRQGKIWTSAGVTASIDLALSIVEDDFGREVALDVARELVVYLKRQGGQPQFSALLQSQNEEHSLAARLRGRVLDSPQESISIHRLAAAFAMSERNFMRTLKKQTGLSPTQFIENVRLELARQYLETSAHGLKQVAFAAGFSSQEHMRRTFKKRIGVSPSDYRQRFSSTGQAGR